MIMIMTFGLIAVFAFSFLFWMKKTPSGRKWLESL
jgi:hypothetical protein